MQRKAQGLSLNTMVIAAIVLIVMAVLIGIFSGYIGNVIPGLETVSESKCEVPLTERSKETGCQSNEKQVYENFGAEFNSKSVCCRRSGECLFPHACRPRIECDSRDQGQGVKDCGTGNICCES